MLSKIRKDITVLVAGLFATYFSDVSFQHFNNIVMNISCYKMEEQAISNAILVLFLDDRIVSFHYDKITRREKSSGFFDLLLLPSFDP